MDTPAQSRSAVACCVGDLWAGLAAMLVTVPSSIAFGVIIFSAMGPEHAGEGAMAGLIGAAVLGLIAPVVGRTAGLISAPCAPAAAVLSALVISFASGTAGMAVEPQAILPVLALVALLAGGLEFVYGLLGGGRLIKFIPYPVVSGYLSGVGVLIAIGQIPKLFGFPRGTRLLEGLLSPGLWRWEGLVIGGVTIAVMLLAPRVTRRVPGAILALLAGIAVYGVLALVVPSLCRLEGNLLVVGPLQTAGSFRDTVTARMLAFLSIPPGALRLIVVPAFTLSVLLAIDTLKSCVGLEAMTRTRHHADRELLGQGIGNMAAVLLGGVPGAGTLGPSLVNVTAGARSFRAGMVEGGLVVLTLVFLARWIAWVPLAALAGILLVIACRMFDRSMFRLLRSRAGQLDFAVIVVVIVVSLVVDLVAAAGVGMAMAILLFTRDQTRGNVIHRKAGLDTVSSTTRRLPDERHVLESRGADAVLCELQGNLFFGTTDQLMSHLETDLRTRRFILFDMRRVHSMDYTAAHAFERMHGELAERGGQLLFSGMPSALIDQRDFEHYLVQLGVARAGGGVMIADTLDSALEWMEDRILESAGVQHVDAESALDLAGFELFRQFDEAALRALASRVEARSVPAGAHVFTRGEGGDELFLVRRGSVRILLPLEGGKHHHLATIGRGDFFGEVSFLDRGLRSADVDAKGPTDLYVLSRSRFDELVQQDARLGGYVFSRLAGVLADRLRHADIELRALEER